MLANMEAGADLARGVCLAVIGTPSNFSNSCSSSGLQMAVDRESPR